MTKKTFKAIKQGIKEAKEGVDLVSVGKGKRFETIEAMLDDKRQNYNILDWIEIYWHRYFWNYITDWKYQLPNWWQRGQRGWGKADTWDFSYYLSKVIYEGLTHMKKNGNGYIVWKNSNTDAQNKVMADKVWDEMIYAFKLAYDVERGERHFYTPGFKKQDKSRFKCLTKKEYDKQQKGMRTFIKYFHCLWD